MGGETTKNEHFVEVLDLKEKQVKALEEQYVNSILRFRKIAKEEETFSQFFLFEESNNPKLFPNVLSTSLLEAWEWLDGHRAKLDEDDGHKWFLANFGESFELEVSRRKREKTGRNIRIRK